MLDPAPFYLMPQVQLRIARITEGEFCASECGLATGASYRWAWSEGPRMVSFPFFIYRGLCGAMAGGLINICALLGAYMDLPCILAPSSVLSQRHLIYMRLFLVLLYSPSSFSRDELLILNL